MPGQERATTARRSVPFCSRSWDGRPGTRLVSRSASLPSSQSSSTFCSCNRACIPRPCSNQQMPSSRLRTPRETAAPHPAAARWVPHLSPQACRTACAAHSRRPHNRYPTRARASRLLRGSGGRSLWPAHRRCNPGFRACGRAQTERTAHRGAAASDYAIPPQTRKRRHRKHAIARPRSRPRGVTPAQPTPASARVIAVQRALSDFGYGQDEAKRNAPPGHRAGHHGISSATQPAHHRADLGATHSRAQRSNGAHPG